MAHDRFCCFRVHTIGMILGSLGSISAVISILIIGFSLGYLDRIVEEFVKNHPDKVDFETVRAAFLAILVVGLILTAIHLISSILLIAGTVKNKHLLLLPWLINSFLGIVYLFMALIVTVNGGVHSSAPDGEIMKMVTPIILSLSIQIILWSAIYKLFQTIRSQSNAENQDFLQALQLQLTQGCKSSLKWWNLLNENVRSSERIKGEEV